MKDNIMTRVSEGVYKHLEGFDDIVKGVAGDLPFNMKVMTSKDRRERINNLKSVQDMAKFVNTYGKEAVEEELRNYYEGRF